MARVIPAEVVEMLRDLEVAASGLGVRYMVVGAGARILLCDLPMAREGRATRDWDFGVWVEDWAQFHSLVAALLGGGFNRDRNDPVHRLRHRAGTKIDLVPFGGSEDARRQIEWPDTRSRMDVAGFREAYDDAKAVGVGSEVSVKVLTLPGLLVLKAIAYEDRRNSGIVHDLDDLDFALRSGGETLEASYVFEEAGRAIRAGDVDFANAAAYVLGLDVARRFPGSVAHALMTVAGRLEDPDAPELRSLSRRTSHSSDETFALAVAGRWRALGLGLRRS